MCLSGSFSHSNFFCHGPTNCFKKQALFLQRGYPWLLYDLKNDCRSSGWDLALPLATSTQCWILKPTQALPGSPALAARAKPSSLEGCRFSGGSWFQGGFLGLQHPQSSPWGPPRGSDPAGMPGPSCPCFRSLFYTKQYLCKFYLPLSKAVVNLNSEWHIRR